MLSTAFTRPHDEAPYVFRAPAWLWLHHGTVPCRNEFFRDDANFTMLFCSAPIDRPLLTICRILRKATPKRVANRDPFSLASGAGKRAYKRNIFI